MSLTKVTPNIIAVANNVTNKTVGNTTSIPSFTFDGSGVVTSASNVAISGAGITANTVANSAFQTGSVESYMRANSLDFGMRNRIINGAMRIDQRFNGSANTPNDQNYILDRWQARVGQASKFTVQQDSSANTVAGFTSSLKVVSSSAYSVISSDIFTVGQRIEGNNLADLAWGTASAKPVTLSFWVRSSLTGAFGGALNNSAFDRSYPFSYTIVAANTWEQKFITISGDTSGTWLTTNGNGIDLRFSLGVGSQYTTTGGAWTAGNYWQPTGSTSVVGTSGATWYVTGVQLEEGSTPTPFEYRQYGTELNLCYRYFQKFLGTEANEILQWFGVAYNTTSAEGPLTFKQAMRSAPTFTYSTLKITDGATNYSSGAFAMDSVGTYSGRMYCYGNSGITQFRPYYCTAFNTTNAYVFLNAEL